ncbi:MAG: hypothetical protein M3340_01735 [Actinomycetota bacterium]|nr:hypothetical protein [Actinomycetota bacterium]
MLSGIAMLHPPTTLGVEPPVHQLDFGSQLPAMECVLRLVRASRTPPSRSKERIERGHPSSDKNSRKQNVRCGSGATVAGRRRVKHAEHSQRPQKRGSQPVLNVGARQHHQREPEERNVHAGHDGEQRLVDPVFFEGPRVVQRSPRTRRLHRGEPGGPVKACARPGTVHKKQMHGSRTSGRIYGRVAATTRLDRQGGGKGRPSLNRPSARRLMCHPCKGRPRMLGGRWIRQTATRRWREKPY